MYDKGSDKVLDKCFLTSLYYLGSSYYDPEIERFLNADGISENYEIILYPGVRYEWGD